MQPSVWIYVLAIFFAFVIGVVFGVMAALISRRVIFNRQIRIAERKGAKIVSDARNEARTAASLASSNLLRAMVR